MTTAHNGRRTDPPQPLTEAEKQIAYLLESGWTQTTSGRWAHKDSPLLWPQNWAVRRQARIDREQRIAEGEEE